MTLNPYRLGKQGGGTNAVLPWILQGAGSIQNRSWNSWAEIHPADAQGLGIRNLDWVWVESSKGKIKTRAVVYPGTGQGVVSIPCGLGHSEMGRWAQGRGITPLDLLTGERDPVTGFPHRFSTRVKVYKA
jgi:anaerobic selenocysteine-containing dehydrogenase